MIEFVMTEDEAHLIACANYAYGRNYADPVEVILLNNFGERANQVIDNLPEDAEEATFQADILEVGALTNSIEKLVENLPGIAAMGVDVGPWVTNLNSLTRKILAAVKEARRAEESGEGGHPTDSDRLAPAGEPAGTD